MFRGGARGGHGVDRDVVEAGRHRAFTQEHHRQIVRSLADLVGRQRERREDDPVDDVRAHALEHDALGIGIPARHIEQDDEAERRRLLGDAGRELGEVGGVHRRHGQGEEPRPTVLEAAGGEVGPVLELGHGLLDAGACRRLDVWVVVEHVGCRLDRHARALGDVAKPCSHSSSTRGFPTPTLASGRGLGSTTSDLPLDSRMLTVVERAHGKRSTVVNLGWARLSRSRRTDG